MPDSQTTDSTSAAATNSYGKATAPLRAFGWIGLAYVVALVAAAGLIWLELPWIQEGSALRQSLLADIAATLVIFAFSTGFANASFYDAYWSVAPPVLLAFFIVTERGGAEEALFDVRLMLVSALVVAWAIRLTHNWARGWQGLDHADWRYVDLQAKTGPLWWLVNLLGIHLMPTVLVFLGCVSLYLCAGVEVAPLNAFDLIAVAVGSAALWIESAADNQLRNFRLNPKNSGQTLACGVWAWCRHPNYLGEIGFWLALYIFAYAAVGRESLSLAIWGPVSMLILFVFISIPMIDKRLAGRKGFDAHKSTTFALLPISHWVWRKP